MILQTPHNKSGYTLLELLIVLVIFSLLAGIIIPHLITMYNRVKAAYERDEIFSQISGLSYQAFKQGKKIELTHYPIVQNDASNVEESEESSEFEDGTEYVESADEFESSESSDTANNESDTQLKFLEGWLEGWTLRTNTPILFRANGVCNGGIIYLRYYNEAEFPVKLMPPFCRATQLN